MGAAGVLHDQLILNRRVNVLSSWFSRLAPKNIQILDVGCGDGLLAAAICCKRPDLDIRGVDVLIRQRTHIHVEKFDGTTLPFGDGAFDAVLFSDTLHHTENPTGLLQEAHRVARQWILIKDHYLKGIAAHHRLRFLDWVGNARFGVALPYRYWSEEQWRQAWQSIGLVPEELITRLGLYPGPINWMFGARLQFVARLRK